MTGMTTRSRLEAELLAAARNYSWTWDRATQRLFDELPPVTAGQHPFQRVMALTEHDYDRMLQDPDFIASVDAAVKRIPQPSSLPSAEIAYFSPEFGISETLPQYSGGLGVLAGDHLKAASDLDIPLVGVGLFYRDGFFHQAIADARQRELYERKDPRALGLEQLPVIVDIEMDDRIVKARVWRAEVGRTVLLLLDTDLELNDEAGRHVSDRLYSGNREHRIRQELLMGVGGVRAIRQLGYEPSVFHLNEGHAGFLALELIGEQVDKGLTLNEAIEAVRPKIVFTTHTPVPAGIDRFSHGLMSRYLGVWSERYGVPIEQLLGLAHMPGEDDAFNMAAFCLRVSSRSNGVSKLHGEVSREMFAGVPGGTEITSVTNGVHARTWVAPDLQDVFDDRLGTRWDVSGADAWSGVERIDDAAIRSVRRSGRQRLIDLATARVGPGNRLDPDALTVGFARRFATYKRADLLLADMDRLRSLLADDRRPIQFIFAGKAHPADEAGKEILHRIVAFSKTSEAHGRIVFIPDYEMAVGRALVGGVDVWLNNPLRPNEASGTSGEKAALNGALNLSISDGWWDECFNGTNGWVIPTSDAPDRVERDAQEAASLYDILAEEVVPLFYGNGESPSAAWLARVRDTWSSLGGFVTAARMVSDYDRILYRPDRHR